MHIPDHSRLESNTLGIKFEKRYWKYIPTHHMVRDNIVKRK